MRLAFSTCQAKIFMGRNFRDLAFDRENRENFCLVKIRYLREMHFSLMIMLPTILPLFEDGKYARV